MAAVVGQDADADADAAAGVDRGSGAEEDADADVKEDAEGSFLTVILGVLLWKRNFCIYSVLSMAHSLNRSYFSSFVIVAREGGVVGVVVVVVGLDPGSGLLALR